MKLAFDTDDVNSGDIHNIESKDSTRSFGQGKIDVEVKLETNHGENSKVTYELIFLLIVNEHLRGLLITHELRNLVENEDTHQDEPPA